ncbi:hypothetical protein GGR56DRAFT_628129 [Xylariaceae sp. FL0804]|nr:hypothetical protein GGR56DRAFT_628129 [Xylariaceae sp. FL0804]
MRTRDTDADAYMSAFWDLAARASVAPEPRTSSYILSILSLIRSVGPMAFCSVSPCRSPWLWEARTAARHSSYRDVPPNEATSAAGDTPACGLRVPRHPPRRAAPDSPSWHIPVSESAASSTLAADIMPDPRGPTTYRVADLVCPTETTSSRRLTGCATDIGCVGSSSPKPCADPMHPIMPWRIPPAWTVSLSNSGTAARSR